MIFRVKADRLSTFSQIIIWLSDNGSEHDYETKAEHGHLLVVFKNEHFAVKCKLVWGPLIELVQ